MEEPEQVLRQQEVWYPELYHPLQHSKKSTVLSQKPEVDSPVAQSARKELGGQQTRSDLCGKRRCRYVWCGPQSRPDNFHGTFDVLLCGVASKTCTLSVLPVLECSSIRNGKLVVRLRIF
jgi:hypothetical protein